MEKEKKDKNKKIITITIIAMVVIGLVIATPILYFIGLIVGDSIFNRPSKPATTYAEFPFELVYEYNGKEFTIEESIICDYEGVTFTIDGGHRRDWTCYVTNNDEYGQYYLDKEKHPTLHIQVPLNAEYYMGAPNASIEFANPYIYYVDESTGTMYYEEDLMEVVGAKIISWKPSEPLENNIKK